MTHFTILLFWWVLSQCAGPCITMLNWEVEYGSAMEGSPSPSPSCRFGKAACVPPGRLTELPLVKLYLVFLFHLPIESLSVNDPPDVLDRQKCLTALASLRHAKWFQVWILSLFVSKTVVLSLVLCCMFFCLLFGHSMCCCFFL